MAMVTVVGGMTSPLSRHESHCQAWSCSYDFSHFSADLWIWCTHEPICHIRILVFYVFFLLAYAVVVKRMLTTTTTTMMVKVKFDISTRRLSRKRKNTQTRPQPTRHPNQPTQSNSELGPNVSFERSVISQVAWYVMGCAPILLLPLSSYPSPPPPFPLLPLEVGPVNPARVSREQRSRNEFESKGAHVRSKAPGKYFVAPLHLFGSTSTISRFGVRFRDEYSLVSFFFAVFLLTVPHVQPFVKWGQVPSCAVESAPLWGSTLSLGQSPAKIEFGAFQP